MIKIKEPKPELITLLKGNKNIIKKKNVIKLKPKKKKKKKKKDVQPDLETD